MDAVDQYYGKVYEKLAVQPTAGGLRYLKQLPADHSVPTDNIIGLKVGSQVGDCKAFASPHLNAYEVFDGRATDTYKALMPKRASPSCRNSASRDNRARCTWPSTAAGRGTGSMVSASFPSLYGGDSGWTHFVENAGYNEWADANDIVVLYPQAEFQGSIQHAKPQGCWDLWGYTDANYHTRDGQHIKAVWKMVQALVPKLGQQALPEQ